MSAEHKPQDSPSVGYEFMREQHGVCAVASPDGDRLCIKDADHDGRHGWEAQSPHPELLARAQELSQSIRFGGAYGDIQLADLLDGLVEQLKTLRRHDEAATQDAVTFRKRMVQLEEAIRHELGVTHGDDTIRRLRAAIDAPYPASKQDDESK